MYLYVNGTEQVRHEGLYSQKRLSLFFNSRLSVIQATTYQSNGVNLPVAGILTVSVGQFSINGSPYSTTGTAAIGDTIRLQVDSSADPGGVVEVTLYVDGVAYDTWSVTTAMGSGYALNPDGSNMLNPDYSRTVNPS